MIRPLRIFLSCQQDRGGTPHPVPAYRFWREYFFHAFAEAGHELLEAPDCDWAEGLQPFSSSAAVLWRQNTWDRALAWIRDEHARRPIDFFLAYLYPQQIHQPGIEEIRSLGIPCVNFFCDNVREFRLLPSQFRGFDLHWVPEFKALPLYRQAGLAVIHAPMPCWISPQLRTPPFRESRPVSFIGTRDELRAAFFADAFRRGLDARLWGRGWTGLSEPGPEPTKIRGMLANQIDFHRQHGLAGIRRKIAGKLFPVLPVVFDFTPFAEPAAGAAEYWEITRESIVCLGVNRYPSPRHSPLRPDTYSRLRDLEAPMAGACYLTEWTEGLDHLYELGTEIETYRSPAELVEKVRALTRDPTRRAQLRAAAQRRALSHHTIPLTIERIARQLNLA